ncbi:hypothetical protein [Sporolactobacillus terrae]|uniref:hypothetical protein n=1 Tax=Sporolactobacillus terrae TaxID=269673 RepID=UPI001119788C|nr:hypothetical protein [Sporolactobacillus terrae]
MRKIVEHSQLRQMLSYRICYKDKSEQQQIKNQLKDEVMSAYGDKWIRLAEGTRSAIDEAMFMATEKGFSFMSKDYLTRHGISKRTLDRAFNFLADKGLIYIVYRRKGCLNLTGKPIYLFTSHSYFKHWVNFLSLDVALDVTANVAAENSQTSILASDSEDIPVSTSFELPNNNLKELSNKDRSEKADVDTDNINDDLDYLPSYIDRTFGTIYKAHFGLDIKRINQLWTILQQQAYKVNIEPENVPQAGIWSLKQLIGQMKIKKIKNLYAYYTQIVKDKCHEIFNQELEDMGADLSQSISFSLPYD